MRYLLLYIFLGFNVLSYGQQHVTRFKLQETEGKVLLSWTTDSAFTCEDIEVQHRAGHTAFKTIHTFLGTCGSEDKAVDYTYVFETPTFNATNTFRLKLGAFGYSDTMSIDLIAYDGRKPRVIPSPADQNSAIYFQNETNDRAEIQLVSANGLFASRGLRNV